MEDPPTPFLQVSKVFWHWTAFTLQKIVKKGNRKVIDILLTLGQRSAGPQILPVVLRPGRTRGKKSSYKDLKVPGGGLIC